MLDEHGASVVDKLSGVNEDPGAFALQAVALRHIARADPDLNVPRGHHTDRRRGHRSGRDRRPGSHYLRVLTWLPGETVEQRGPDSVDAVRVGGFVSWPG